MIVIMIMGIFFMIIMMVIVNMMIINMAAIRERGLKLIVLLVRVIMIFKGLIG